MRNLFKYPVLSVALLLIAVAAFSQANTIDVAQSGLGQVSITAGELASGTYQYSLMIKGKLVDIKQMELIR